jgi:hypothetical protein
MQPAKASQSRTVELYHNLAPSVMLGRKGELRTNWSHGLHLIKDNKDTSGDK